VNGGQKGTSLIKNNFRKGVSRGKRLDGSTLCDLRGGGGRKKGRERETLTNLV